MTEQEMITNWLTNNEPKKDLITDENLINTRDTILTDFNGNILGRTPTKKVLKRQIAQVNITILT